MKQTRIILLLFLLIFSSFATGKEVLQGHWSFSNNEIRCHLVLNCYETYLFNPHQPEEASNGFLQVYMINPESGISSLLSTYSFFMARNNKNGIILKYRGGRDWEQDIYGECKLTVKGDGLTLNTVSENEKSNIFDGLTFTNTKVQSMSRYTKKTSNISTIDETINTTDNIFVRLDNLLHYGLKLIWEKSSWYIAILIYLLLIIAVALALFFGGNYILDGFLPRRVVWSAMFLVFYGSVISFSLYHWDLTANLGRFTLQSETEGFDNMFIVLCTYLSIFAIITLVGEAARKKDLKFLLISVGTTTIGFLVGMLLTTLIMVAAGIAAVWFAIKVLGSDAIFSSSNKTSVASDNSYSKKKKIDCPRKTISGGCDLNNGWSCAVEEGSSKCPYGVREY